MVYWLVQLELQLGDPGSIPGSCHYCTVYYTHVASPVSQLQETGVQKESFRRLSDYRDSVRYKLSFRAHYNIT